MNTKQAVVIWLAVAWLLVYGLTCAPYRASSPGESVHPPSRRSLFWPRGSEAVQLDVGRAFTELAFVALLTTGIVIALSWKKD
jgi:hypothetical protein